MKLVTQLLLATASLTIGLATLDGKNASAAIINYAFIVDSPTNRGQGFFSFDDTTFSDDNIPVAIVKSLSFKFDGEPNIVYTEQDDLNFPDFPVVFLTTFLTGEPFVGLDYVFDDRVSDLSYEILGEDFTIFSSTAANTEISVGTVSYTRVPEPTTLAASFVTCGVGCFMKRKGKLSKKFKV
ncbi:PEP-CTERM sorting domain-containing protein [Fortiea sp. LEGE XX443]|uniref:PEP-CTERM sorting domain-containing protein n=1 Tax=Fortiea sp. LEGE XX443 TaxID=1828611 RepID=UPI0018803790|nr:PEP-CTERM sorting domain-containing protein [Fortiea sp. LEGE XX443]MBE9004385.1 PEP-CTERM sorting domain-containing protein [Fortiea sp. LEGE XX443]